MEPPRQGSQRQGEEQETAGFGHRRQWAVADFDPAPQLDAFWADALRPFRPVPRRDFGYNLVLRVIEEPKGPRAVEVKPVQ